MEAPQISPADREARQDFYDTIDRQNLTPLWEVLAGLVTKEPVSRTKPHLWKFAEVRPHVLQAGSLITAEEAVAELQTRAENEWEAQGLS